MGRSRLSKQLLECALSPTLPLPDGDAMRLREGVCRRQISGASGEGAMRLELLILLACALAVAVELALACAGCAPSLIWGIEPPVLNPTPTQRIPECVATRCRDYCCDIGRIVAVLPDGTFRCRCQDGRAEFNIEPLPCGPCCGTPGPE